MGLERNARTLLERSSSGKLLRYVSIPGRLFVVKLNISLQCDFLSSANFFKSRKYFTNQTIIRDDIKRLPNLELLHRASLSRAGCPCIPTLT